MWQLNGPCTLCIRTVPIFLGTHLSDDCPTPCILSRQLLKVAAKVFANLFFGFRNKAKGPAIAKHAARSAYCKGSGIPQRAEPAWPAVKFCQSFPAPAQMIEFLVGCSAHLLSNFSIVRDRGMPLVKSLGSDFAGMIHPHEAGRVSNLSSAQEILFNACCRIRSGHSGIGGSQGPQCTVNTANKAIDR